MQSVQVLDRYAGIVESMMPCTKPQQPATIHFAGHTRRVYPPLLLYGQLLTAESSGTKPADLLPAIEKLDSSLWSMLVRRAAAELFDRPRWIAQSRQAFENLAQNQQPSGEFLPADPHANPETRWYEELTLLHAAASYSVRDPAEQIQTAVRRSALFHQEEIQPDHATAEPWGLLAFIQHAPPMADQVLHALSMQYPDGVTGPALFLLGDVLYGLRRLLRNDA